MRRSDPCKFGLIRMKIGDAPARYVSMLTGQTDVPRLHEGPREGYFALNHETWDFDTILPRNETTPAIIFFLSFPHSYRLVEIRLFWGPPPKTCDRLVWERYLCGGLEIFIQDVSLYELVIAHSKLPLVIKARLTARYVTCFGVGHGSSPRNRALFQ